MHQQVRAYNRKDEGHHQTGHLYPLCVRAVTVRSNLLKLWLLSWKHSCGSMADRNIVAERGLLLRLQQRRSSTSCRVRAAPVSVQQELSTAPVSNIQEWAQCGLATTAIRQLVQLELKVPFLTADTREGAVCV